MSNRSLPRATKPGKKAKKDGLTLHAALVQANKDNARRIEDGLQYVMIGNKPVSIADTEAIEAELSKRGLL
jgi:outer membrane receptor for monomeric catechols